jgi:site-specific DNA-cytosine methylase
MMSALQVAYIAQKGDRMRVLLACEFSGVVTSAFLELGHDAWSCDLLETEFVPPYPPYEGSRHFQGDVRDIINQYRFDMMIAFPPCTDLAASGARWWPEKRTDGRQQASIDFFMALANAPIPRICIENPVGIMSSAWRKPDQIIQPWQFGHGETKATCLWLKNLPLLKPTNIVEGRIGRVHHEPPSPDRWKNRSRTYQGIADAMAEQWG